MRVLFSAHGAFGHVLPMVGLASALRDAGHAVCFATGAPLCATVTDLGLDAVPAGFGDEALLAATCARWPETADQPPTRWAPRMFAEIAAPAMRADLEPIVAGFRPDLVVREEGEHAAAQVAASAGIPCVTHGWGSPLAAAPLPGGTVLDPCPPSLYGSSGSPCPVLAVRTTESPAARSDGRLAYVGFGTVPLYRDRPALLRTVVETLLATGVDVMVTTDAGPLAAELAGLDPQRVRVECWVALTELLADCALVVSHGGAGTSLAALTAGVPLLLLPQGAPSQERMVRACVARGVALTAGPDELPTAIAALLCDDRYRANAQEVADEIASLPGPRDVVGVLERTVGA